MKACFYDPSKRIMIKEKDKNSHSPANNSFHRAIQNMEVGMNFKTETSFPIL